MKEKELLSQLNNLKSIKPDNEWKKDSRDILLSQISSGDYSLDENKQVSQSGVLYYLNMFFHQPVLVVSVILIAVLGGGIFSINASKNTKPGDSLYIAKIISEKARSTITFNEEKKAMLGIEFAGNRAKEMAQVLSEPGNGERDERVKKLSRSFKKEIDIAKARLRSISEEGEIVEDLQLFSANLGKEDKGMQVYDPNSSDNNIEVTSEEEPEKENINLEIEINTQSTTTIEKVLEEAEELFANEDYDGTLNKLDEINNIIEKDGEGDDGEVRGESENSATTTGEVLGASEEQVEE